MADGKGAYHFKYFTQKKIKDTIIKSSILTWNWIWSMRIEANPRERKSVKKIWIRKSARRGIIDNDSTEDYQPEPEPSEEIEPLSEDQLKCEFCPKIFESKDLLEEH
ncbi:unnamed protein product, partial [Allacma fusca]